MQSANSYSRLTPTRSPFRSTSITVRTAFSHRPTLEFRTRHHNDHHTAAGKPTYPRHRDVGCGADRISAHRTCYVKQSRRRRERGTHRAEVSRAGDFEFVRAA